MIVNMFSTDFLIGLGFGFVFGIIPPNILWYNYWRKSPLYAFMQSIESKEKLYKLLEEGVEKGYYTKEEIIIGGQK